VADVGLGLLVPGVKGLEGKDDAPAERIVQEPDGRCPALAAVRSVLAELPADEAPELHSRALSLEPDAVADAPAVAPASSSIIVGFSRRSTGARSAFWTRR